MPKYLVLYRVYGTIAIEAVSRAEAREQAENAQPITLTEGLSFQDDDVEITSVEDA